VQQPFKQAHREIYTPAAEGGSNTHQSTQFADHILRQHQMVRLAKSRGWIATPQGVGDFDRCPELRLPHRGLRVELAIEGVYRDHDDVNSSKHFLAITTGAVTFFDHEDVAVPLAALPPMVFSEVMRHVDLFVSVASIANEPEESDEEFQAYLRSFPQSELRASGEVRKETLEGLVSRMKIADRCSFTDRFLKVGGDIAGYRIHIGSGTVLLEGEDRFLRFESDKAANAAATRFFKSAPPPFEGDDLVALIIGRALVLAKDKNITDEVLLRQIRGVPD
jgi:hypothetical protein